MNTSLIYIGNINLLIKVKDKLLNLHTHNNGTDFLKKEFAKLLCNVKSDYIYPAYFSLLVSDDDGETWHDALVSYLNTSGGIYDLDANGWYARFNISLPYSSINGSNLPITLTDSRLFRFMMLSRYDITELSYHELMYVPVEAAVLSELQEDTSAFITWTMRLDNPLEETE